MRVVLDANVIISFLLTRGETISSVFEFWDRGEIKVLVSEEILKEIETVLGYEKFADLLEPWEKEALLEKLRLQAVFIEVETKLDVVDDPKDNKYVECAVEGGADFIVSGDSDLLSLGSYENIKIVTPKEFVKSFK